MPSKWLRVLMWASWLAALRLIAIAVFGVVKSSWFLDQGMSPDLVAAMQMEILYDLPTAALLIFWPIWAMRRK